jgi:hypothetical protein
MWSTRLISIARLLIEWVLTQFDKAVNWARQGSMWPMTCKSFLKPMFQGIWLIAV